MAPVRTENAKATQSIAKVLRSQTKPTAPERGTPGAKKALKEAKKAQWETWVQHHQWKYDKNYRQEVGWTVIHLSEAKKHFKLTTSELFTLPYVEFPNNNVPGHPDAVGRAFRLDEVKALLYRKFATLESGLTIPVVKSEDETSTEAEFLKRGKELAEQWLNKLAEAYRKRYGKSREPQTWKIVPVKAPREPAKYRPGGSWWTRVYEDGDFIGHWLMFQFQDFDSDDQDPLPHPEVPDRFVPLGGDLY